MSAYVVSKTHIDLLVKAADEYGRVRAECQGSRFQWWKTDEDGAYTGWFAIDPYAESMPDKDGYMEFLTPSQAGQLLVNENVRSVTHRYSEPGRTAYYGSEVAATMDDADPDAGELPGPIDAYYMGPYIYKDPGYTLSPGEVFKAIDNLDYQSCEHPEWRTSTAFAFLESLRETVCRFVDGYDGAPWGFDEIPKSSATR